MVSFMYTLREASIQQTHMHTHTHTHAHTHTHTRTHTHTHTHTQSRDIHLPNNKVVQVSGDCGPGERVLDLSWSNNVTEYNASITFTVTNDSWYITLISFQFNLDSLSDAVGECTVCGCGVGGCGVHACTYMYSHQWMSS